MEIFFVTNNMNKVREAEAILKEFGIVIKPINVKKIEIQHESLDEIARIAAQNAYQEIKKPVVVEDSGLFINVLNGFPGPYSSYVYKTIGLKGILKLLEDYKEIELRKARFVAVVALALSNNVIHLFKGVTEGLISFEIRGDKGFGYDPIFIPVGSTKTFAEMSIEEKNRYSHRGKAFKELGLWLQRFCVSNKSVCS
ncbi:XTP/dITP diphosphatase [Ignisphaera sp. 4213-co]|uniref:dITP/XTP pyrophosphatase n=1 Tax=Ignisphaera cupida TaxID=3050454 RepID=A0ABD4Z5W3_9CREN|nr:XTP/dITP diphosphatase [Ignisphaera sp. 4213-co]MDK6028333.1 XTP/dITP diphosphatase [Ignisphaera sp. 4213-co]